METKPSINDVTFKNNTETLAVVSTAELVGNGGKKRADRAGGHAGHSWLNLALIVLTWVVFISTLVVNGLAASGGLGNLIISMCLTFIIKKLGTYLLLL